MPPIGATSERSDNLLGARVLIAGCGSAHKDLAPARRVTGPTGVVRPSEDHTLHARIAVGHFIRVGAEVDKIRAVWLQDPVGLVRRSFERHSHQSESGLGMESDFQALIRGADIIFPALVTLPISRVARGSRPALVLAA